VVVGVDAPYDHTYPLPGLPFCQLMQSAHVGRRPAWKSASGWSICHVPLPLLQVHVIVDACAGVVSASTAAGAKISQRNLRGFTAHWRCEHGAVPRVSDACVLAA
jgi:hypothetical protein